MFRSYRIGTAFGFPIEINISFLLVLALALLFLGGLQGVLAILILFASVLLHELGHALVARHLGVTIAGIELHLFGGAAKMTSLPKTANDEVLIAAAGPAVSFALGGVGFLLGSMTGFGPLQMFGWINIILGAFNLVPALPMDGGRILRALLTRKRDFVKATEISITIARGFAVLLGIYGLMTWNLMLPFLAVFLWFIGSAELRMAQSMRDSFVYDQNGYRYMYADVDVYSDGFPGAGSRAGPHGAQDPPFFGVHRPVRTGGFVIRQRNGRLVIELIQ